MKAVVSQSLVRQRLDRWNLIRFQIGTYCLLHNIQVTSADLDLLVLLAIKGKTDLNGFCDLLANTKLSTGVRIKKQSGKAKEYTFIFNSAQSGRNATNKLAETGLIKREGKSHIKIELSPEIHINTDSNLLLTYQLLCFDSNEIQEPNT